MATDRRNKAVPDINQSVDSQHGGFTELSSKTAAGLEAMRLEDRILMSATPVDESMATSSADFVAAENAASTPHIYAPLSDTTAPTALGFTNVIDSEDANDRSIDLADHFADNVDPSLTYLILNNSNAELFAEITQSGSGGSTLNLDFANDAEGEAILTVRAIDDAGNFVDDEMRVTLLPVNDRPTTSGLLDITVPEDGPATVIDLFATFDDVEDADHELTFTITQNSNPALFSSIVIDQASGTLTFNYAPNASGSAEITIRATDTEGLYLEMAAGHGFEVLDVEAGTIGVHQPDIDYGEAALWTHWYFFPIVNGDYDYTTIDEVKLRTQLQAHPVGVPIIVNIEQGFFDNTPEGRDRFAEIFEIINEERPDIDFGLYRIMPRRAWFEPTRYVRSLEDSARGLATYFANSSVDIADSYQAWHDENALFSNVPVAAEFGGLPLADYVDTIFPSLYTPYRNVLVRNPHTLLDYDAATDSFSIDGYVADDLQVQIWLGFSATLPTGVIKYHDYYVVNAQGGQFQLSETIGGAPIQFDNGGTGDVYLEIKATQYLWHDANVVYWDDYATLNILEARNYSDHVIPFLSPSLNGVGVDHLEKNFFRFQLDTLFELADGVALFNPPSAAATYANSPGWWEALIEFDQYINTPTQFTITVGSSNDRPYTDGIPNLFVPEGTVTSVVNLYDYIHDTDHLDSELTFELTSITSPQKIESTSIGSGKLTLNHAVGEVGISFVTVRAVDPGGLSVSDTFMVQVGQHYMPASTAVGGMTTDPPIRMDQDRLDDVDLPPIIQPNESLITTAQPLTTLPEHTSRIDRHDRNDVATERMAVDRELDSITNEAGEQTHGIGFESTIWTTTEIIELRESDGHGMVAAFATELLRDDDFREIDGESSSEFEEHPKVLAPDATSHPSDTLADGILALSMAHLVIRVAEKDVVVPNKKPSTIFRRFVQDSAHRTTSED